MTAWHPSIDQIADYDAGLTAASDTGQVAEHLAACAECRDLAAGIGEVSDLLAAAAGKRIAMPEDVAARLDEALTSASRERAAGVPSLAERRSAVPAHEPGNTKLSTGRTARRSRWVLGTAAAVAVFAIGGAVISDGLPGLSSQDSDDSSAGSAADSAEHGAAGGGSAADRPGNPATAPNAVRDAPPRLDEDNVATYARGLAAGERLSIGAARERKQAIARCGYPSGTDMSSSSSGSSQPVQAFVVFDGDPALLRVATADRRLTVLSCPGSARVLYRSSY